MAHVSSQSDERVSEHTESGIQHVQSHLVTFLRSSDCNQAFVAIVLRFVDLDDAARELADLVDLGSSLSDDRADHVVGDEDLLGERLAGKHGHWIRGRASLGGRSTVGLAGLMRSSARISSGVLGVRVVDWGLRGRRGRLPVEIGDTVGVGGRALRRVRVALIGFRVAVISVKGLRLVRNDLHSTGNGSSGSTGSRGVGRRGGSSVSVGELLHERAGDVVGSDMDGISDAGHNQGALSRQRQGRAGRIKSSARSFLDLANTRAGLANDRTDQDVRD